MTYHYDDIDPQDALYNAMRAYPGGIPALAARMRSPTDISKPMSPETLKKKASPAVDSHQLSYQETIQIIEFLLEAKPDAAELAIAAFNWNFRRIAIQLPSGEGAAADNIFRELSEILQDEGELARLLNQAMADGTIAPREGAAIDKQLQVVVQHVMELRAVIKSLAQSGTPK